MTLIHKTRLPRRFWIALAAIVALAGVGCRTFESPGPSSPALSQSKVVSTNPVPIELDDGHVIVRGSINGRAVRLVFDTGASHVLISPEAAADARIQIGNKIRISGFGDQKGTAQRGVADTIRIGPAVAEQVAVAAMPIPLLLGDDGLLGFSFLRRFNFRLDYEEKSLWFAEATHARFQGAEAGIQVPPNVLVVDAEVDGTPGRFLLDTGASQALILEPWFVERHQLRTRYRDRLSIVTGQGLLGITHGEIVRVRTFKLAGQNVTNVCAEFGSGLDRRNSSIAGFVGAALLRKFTVIYDPGNRRLWLEPNSGIHSPPVPPAVIRTGFVCLPDGGHWMVKDVHPTSPADEAGVRVGDELIEINGAPVASLKPGGVKRPFQAVPGTRVHLRVQSPGKPPRETVLVLRDLI